MVSRSPAAALSKEGVSHPGSDDQTIVRAQLHRLLESPAFRTSKRCRLFFEFVVDHAYGSPTSSEPLKERMIGVHVFGRQPSYDTAADPVVRITAGEIRRRLGQYYADPAHQHELRIELPAGGYTPTYHWPAAPTPAPGIAIAAAAEAMISPAREASVAGAAGAPALLSPLVAPKILRTAASPARRRLWQLLAIVASVSAAAGIATAVFLFGQARTPFDRFWAPLVDSTVPVLVCVGSNDVYELSERLRTAIDARPPVSSAPAAAGSAATGSAATASAAGSAAGSKGVDALMVQLDEVQRVGTRFVSMSDAMALSRVAGLFQSRGTPYQLRENRATSFPDLRAAPTVLIGMFSNAWTLELGSGFRFTPAIDGATRRVLIIDRLHPERTDWHVIDPWPALNVTRDYALVSRVRDPVTGTLVIIAAGITPYGTTAAVEWLTSPSSIQQTFAGAASDWPSRNLQVVLETRILHGTAGPPKVVATHIW
jgi:hypothetical protein